MSHEAAVSPVQLHLFDSRGSFCAGLTDGDPAEEALFEALDRAEVPRPGRSPVMDVAIPAGQVSVVVQSLRMALQKMLDATSFDDVAGAYDRAVIEVLGRTVPIRVRDGRHYALKRLNSLYSGLEPAAEARRAIDIFVVPHLDDMDRAILGSVRDGSANADLAEALQGHFAGLATVTPNQEITALMRQRADAASDHDLVAARLRRLEEWGFVRRLEDGSTHATRKLMAIRI